MPRGKRSTQPTPSITTTTTKHARSDISSSPSTTSLSSSTVTSSRASPSPSTHHTLPLPSLYTALRKRVITRPSVAPSSPSISEAKTDPAAAMFSSRKYSPLPNPNGNNGRKRAGGGMSTWKRWSLILGVVLVLGVFGWTRMGSTRVYGEGEVWDAENTYIPDLDSKPVSPVDEIDYSSPPFRPLDSEIGRPKTGGSSAEDEEEDDTMHILPIGKPRPDGYEDDDINGEFLPDDDGESPASNPHDPLSDEAKGAAEADSDFTEIDESEGEVDEDVAEANGIPTSFESDPNPAGTAFCKKAHSKGKPLVQYALTIDAGSTGSRIHVYKFHNCQASPSLEYETFKSINPGLSAFAKDPTAAAASLDPLMEEAQRVVPKELWKCSPVEVKATAGLRLLGVQESEAILEEVRNRLETKYDFVVGSDRAVEIMDGKDEGVYAWITANYLLNKIGEGVKSTDTLAVMDLGGASTQIVFEPTYPSKSTETLAEGEHKYLLNFGGKQFTLYQHSYLGYGLMRARRSVHNLVAFTWSFGKGDVEWDELSENMEVPNPCLSRGTTRRVELDPPGRTAVNVTMHGAMGGFEACNRVVELVMAKDAICEVKPCSFNGVYQPSLLDTFPKGQLLALSYFTDRIKPLLPAKTNSLLTISELTSLAKDVCAGPTTWQKRWGKDKAAMAELQDRPEYCLDLTFMNALLGLGYELGPERELMVEKKLRGVELGWALGAGLALVEKAELKCVA